MKARLGALLTIGLLVSACASSDDQLPSSPSTSASSPVITPQSNNGAPMTLSGYADTSATTQFGR